MRYFKGSAESEYDDCQQENDDFMDCKWDRKTIAEYYGYQENDDYSYDQFLDDL